MDPGLVHIRLSSCEKYLRREKKNLAEVESLIELSKLPEVNRLFRAGIISSVIEYFYDGYDEDGFNKFIADVDMDGLRRTISSKSPRFISSRGMIRMLLNW